MPSTELNDLEGIVDRADRLLAYKRYTSRNPHDSRAWHNYARDLLEDGHASEARMAALRAVEHEAAQRTHLSHLVDVGPFELREQVVATRKHQLYRAVRGGQNRPVLLRHLGNRTRDEAERLFAQHRAASDRDVPHLVRALDTVEGHDGALYQVLANVEGVALSTLFSPQPLALAPAAAAQLVADVARALDAMRNVGIETVDLRPEFLLRDRQGAVCVLGPLSRPDDTAWLAAEERDGSAGDIRADVLRLGLLLFASSGEAVPPPDRHGGRTFDALPSRWLRHERLLAITQRATATHAGERYDLGHFSEVLSHVASQSTVVGPGMRLGGRELRERLGTGGLSEVWLAEDRAGTPFAVKILVRDDKGDARLRFQQEADVGLKLDHPGIIKVLSTPSMTERPLHFAMELIQRGSLARRLKKGPLSVEQTCQVGIQVAEAMAVVHDAGIVHRDLTPANILLVDADEGTFTVKVTDFGAAKVRDELSEAGQPLTEANEPIGTIGYRAPEQCVDPRSVDGRADIWSLGAVVYHCVTGQALPPLQASAGVPPSLGGVPIPQALAASIRKMLAHRAVDRFPDMSSVAIALREATRSEPDAERGGGASGDDDRIRPAAHSTITVERQEGGPQFENVSGRLDSKFAASSLRSEVQRVVERALLRVPDARRGVARYRIAFALDEMGSAGDSTATLRYRPRPRRDETTVDATFAADSDLGHRPARATTGALVARVTVQLSVQVLLTTMERALKRAVSDPPERVSAPLRKAHDAINTGLSWLRERQHELATVRWTTDACMKWHAALRDFDATLVIEQQGTREVCERLLQTLTAVPMSAGWWGPTGESIAGRVLHLSDEYRRNEALMLACWLGSTAVSRLADVLGADTEGDTGTDAPGALSVAATPTAPAQPRTRREELERDRKTSVDVGDQLYNRALGFTTWFRGQRFEAGVRMSVQDRAVELSRSSKLVFDLIEAQLAASQEGRVLPVEVVVDTADGVVREVTLAVPW